MNDTFFHIVYGEYLFAPTNILENNLFFVNDSNYYCSEFEVKDYASIYFLGNSDDDKNGKVDISRKTFFFTKNDTKNMMRYLQPHTKKTKANVFFEKNYVVNNYQKINKYGSFFLVKSVENFTDFLLFFRYIINFSAFDIKVSYRNTHFSEIQRKLDIQLKKTFMFQKQTENFQTIDEKLKRKKIKSYIEKFIKDGKEYYEFELIIYCCGKTASHLNQHKKFLSDVAKKYKVYLHSEIFLQKDLFMHYYFDHKLIFLSRKQAFFSEKQMKQLVKHYTLTFSDKYGFILGENQFQHKIQLDLWKINLQRTNHNFLIVGRSGMGKTSCAHHILRNQKKVSLYILDPENEYFFKSSEINRGCQIKIDQQKALRFMYQKKQMIDNIQLFISEIRYKGEGKDAFLARDEVIIFLEMLQHHKIKKISFELLFTLLEKKFTLDHPTVKYIYQYLSDINHEFFPKHNGGQSHINHYCFFDLFSQEKPFNQDFLTVFLSALWQEMIKQKGKKILLIDESYLFLQNYQLDLLIQMRNIFKRARKYNVSVGLISQNIADLMYSDFRHILFQIFDNTTYKFVFAQGEQDMKILTDYLHLSSHRVKEIEKLKKQECYLCVGKNLGKVKISDV